MPAEAERMRGHGSARGNGYDDLVAKTGSLRTATVVKATIQRKAADRFCRIVTVGTDADGNPTTAQSCARRSSLPYVRTVPS
jgi:hypothetical protein